MHETVRRMCNDHPNAETGLKVLNVGFGLGIVGVPVLPFVYNQAHRGDTYADRFILPGAPSSAFGACYY